METGKRSQRIILILSAAIPGQSALCTFINRSAHRDEGLICLPPLIVMVSMARGPPFFFAVNVFKCSTLTREMPFVIRVLGKEV